MLLNLSILHSDVGDVPPPPLNAINIDKDLESLSQCLVQSANYAQSDLCWIGFKREQVLKVLDRIERMSYSQTKKFAQVVHYAPHQIMLPTHECSMLNLQRFGPKPYAATPEGRHPDGPKWMCAEYLQTPPDEKCVIFSVGSNGDFQFEQAMFDFVG
eukprot:jgi/Hompol1/3813/HPOL_006752-RA